MSTSADLEAFAQRKATTAFILAVCGFVLLPFIASVFAVIAASQARTMFREHPEYRGDGMVMPALILGWIGVVVGGALLVYVFS